MTKNKFANVSKLWPPNVTLSVSVSVQFSVSVCPKLKGEVIWKAMIAFSLVNFLIKLSAIMS